MKFRQKYGAIIQLPTFFKLRPKNVLKVDAHKYRTGLCETCLNISNKAAILKQLGVSGVCDKYDLLNLTLCEGDRKSTCIDRLCMKCGVDSLDRILQVPQVDPQKSVKWKRWEMSTTEKPKKKVLVCKEGTVNDLLMELKVEMKAFAKHIHTATWQQGQFIDLHKNLPDGWVVSVQDFAENYRHTTQDEVSSAFFAYEQTTLFTNVSIYKCPECNERVEESVVFITSDTQHDGHVVKAVCDILQGYLKSKGVKILKHVIFSDGCGAQFKSKVPFHLLLDANTERCFFGSQHGKSQCDSLGGLVKTAASRFVKSGAGSIRNAGEFHEFCEQELARSTTCNGETHKVRSFFIMEKIDRPDVPALKAIPNTRQVHHIKRVSAEKVKVKKLSCFCVPCLNEDPKCEEAAFTGEWKELQLRQTHEKAQNDCATVDSEGKETSTRLKRELVKAKEVTEEAKSKATTTIDSILANSKKNETPTTLKTEKVKAKKVSEEAKSEPITRIDSILVAIQNITSYNELVSKLSKIKLPELGQGMTPGFYEIDEDSLPLVPPGESGVPLKIGADGNCFPRCVSLAQYGNEDRHLEMRVRIIEELAKNSEYYLSAKIDEGGKSNSARSFASFGDFYRAQRLSKSMIRKLYEQEILSIMKPGTYMGAWQLAAAASVLGIPIKSVYPVYGAATVRAELHRIFWPRKVSCVVSKPVKILWTHTSGARLEPKIWRPNHFVLLSDARYEGIFILQ